MIPIQRNCSIVVAISWMPKGMFLPWVPWFFMSSFGSGGLLPATVPLSPSAGLGSCALYVLRKVTTWAHALLNAAWWASASGLSSSVTALGWQTTASFAARYLANLSFHVSILLSRKMGFTSAWYSEISVEITFLAFVRELLYPLLPAFRVSTPSRSLTITDCTMFCT